LENAGGANFRERMAVEAIGTALLTSIVVGCGIAAEQWAVGDAASAATSPAMIAGTIAAGVIMALAAAGGFCLNPVLGFALAIRGQITSEEAPKLAFLQIAGAFAGVALAHWAFDRDLVETGVHAGWGLTPPAREFGAAFLLAGAMLATLGQKPWLRAVATGLAALASYWLAGSGSFANPATTLGHTITSTFFGLRPEDAPALIAAQFAGAWAAERACAIGALAARAAMRRT
jgi:glycerol uptake facilitator-like aquaporin